MFFFPIIGRQTMKKFKDGILPNIFYYIKDKYIVLKGRNTMYAIKNFIYYMWNILNRFMIHIINNPLTNVFLLIMIVTIYSYNRLNSIRLECLI